MEGWKFKIDGDEVHFTLGVHAAFGIEIEITLYEDGEVLSCFWRSGNSCSLGSYDSLPQAITAANELARMIR